MCPLVCVCVCPYVSVHLSSDWVFFPDLKSLQNGDNDLQTILVIKKIGVRLNSFRYWCVMVK